MPYKYHENILPFKKYFVGKFSNRLRNSFFSKIKIFYKSIPKIIL